MRIPGFSSTGSKRPEALFGAGAPVGLPVRLSRASGAEVWDAEGRKYLDFIMALGAVSLGYAHPEVSRAAHAAVDAGVVGPLPPESEERLAERLAQLIPWMERTRFLKTGAEAVAAALRLARASTGRDVVLRCGYHGWHDWSQSIGTPGIPASMFALSEELPFGDSDRARALFRLHRDRLAAVIVEPVIEQEPPREWLTVLREETERAGALLIFDEIKTGFRLAIGGAAERYRVKPDLVVLGKALASGFPLAAVGGKREVMEQVRRTWISSTLATEMVALAAAEATVEVSVREGVPARLNAAGNRLRDGLETIAANYPALIKAVSGLPEMCYLQFTADSTGPLVSRAAAARGLLWKRSAYNFVSLAHTDAMIDKGLELLDVSLAEIARK